MHLPGDEKRKDRRRSVKPPLNVAISTDDFIQQNEESRLKDISPLGAGFTLKRPVERGRLLLLTIPMPKALRRYDFNKSEYKIWGIVQSCIERHTGKVQRSFAVGVAFIGKTAPPQHLKHPGRLYELSDTAPVEDDFWSISKKEMDISKDENHGEVERQTRLQLPEELILELLDENGETIALEKTVTENLSLRGAAVFTQFDAEVGAFVRVTSESQNIKLISIVRDQRNGADGMSRLHLEFIDMVFPLDGLV